MLRALDTPSENTFDESAMEINGLVSYGQTLATADGNA
jgi:hypothetical protein